MKMNDLRTEKNTTKGVSAGAVDFSIGMGSHSIHIIGLLCPHECIHFLLFYEYYYSQEIEAERYMR